MLDSLIVWCVGELLQQPWRDVNTSPVLRYRLAYDSSLVRDVLQDLRARRVCFDPAPGWHSWLKQNQG